MAEPLIQRVYDLKIAGYDDSIQKVEALTAAFNKMDASKKKLNAQLQLKLEAGDQDAVTALIKKIKDLETEMAKLKTQKDSAAKEAALLAKAEKDTAAALLTTEKATVSVARAEQIRSQTRITENKELQRQLDIEEKQRQKLENEKKAVDALEGSYNNLKQQRLALERLTANASPSSSITFNNQTFNFDEAISKIKEMKVLELDYTEKLKLEKIVHEDILKSQQQEIISIQKQRTELQTLTSTSGQSSTVSFQGNTLSFDEAISKAHQLEQAENQLTSKLIVQQNELKTLPANYYNLVAAQKQALELYKITPSTSPFFEEVKQGAIEASNKVQAFNRTLSPDGTLVGEYKSGIINAFKELGLSDVLRKQRDEVNQNLNKLKKESQDLAAEYRKTGTAGAQSFEKIELQLRQNFEQQEQMKKSLVSLDSALHNTGNVGSQISNGIANGFKNAKLQLSQLLLGYVGFQAVFSGLQSGVGIAKELSDQTSNLEVELGKAAGGASKLVDELAKIDTRTKLVVLEQIANIAAKAGVSEEKLVGVTAALDKIKIAFGKDFGDVEQGTETLVKIINIFEGSDKVTGDNLLRVGNAVRTLANESVAGVPFINDFSQRMAGLKGIADISLPAVLGLASGFEQFGQSSEVAGTTLIKVIPKLATDTEKYSKVAGLTQQAFSDLLKNNPAEALIRVSEGLTKSGSSLEEISTAFADSELGSGRIAAVLGVVGSKADDFRKSIASAGQAYQDTGNIEDAFARKNENLASTLDKISKKFADAANSKAFQLTLTAIAGVISFLLGNIGILIGVITAYAAVWAIANSAMIAARISTIAANIAFQIQYGLLIAQQIVTRAYALTLTFLTGITNGTTVATRLLGNAMRLLPLGIILTIVGVLIAAFKVFGSTITGTTDALRKQALQAKILNEIRDKSTQAIAEEISKIDILYRTATNLNLSYESRRKAIDSLKAQHPEFLKGLDNEKISLKGLKEAYDLVTAGIRLKADAEAASALASEQKKNVLEVSTVRFKIEQAASQPASSGRFSVDKLTPEEQKLLFTDRILKSTTARQGAGDSFTFSEADLKILQTTLESEQRKREEVYQAYIDTTSATTEKLNKFEDDRKEKNLTLLTKKANNEKLSINELTDLIKGIDEQRAKLKEGDPKLLALEKEREAFQKRLDDLNGKETKTKQFRGSRIPGEDIDKLRDIDAAANEERVKLEEAFLKRQLLIRANGSRILINNEVTYLNELLRINETAIKNKLSKLDDSNAAERLKRSELNVELIKDQQDTDKKVFDIKKRELDAELSNIKKVAELQLGSIVDDPNKTSLEKLKAREVFLTRQYVVQVSFNESEKKLEEKYNQISVDNESKRSDGLLTIRREINKNSLELNEEYFKDLERRSQDASDKQINESRQNVASRTTAVLQDDSLSTIEKAKKIRIIEQQETLKLAAQEEAAARIALQNKEEELKKGLATEKEVSDARTKLRLAELALAKTFSEQELGFLEKLNQGFKNALHNITDFFKGVKKSRDEVKADLNEALQATAGIIKNAIAEAKQAFFENQNRQVDKEKEVAEKRLSIEEEQVINAAQSEEEKESVHRQFDEKRKALDKKSGEEKKAIALKQMAIDFGIAVVKTLATYPFPFSLLPVAGLTLAYFLQRAAVQKQQFAGGGRVRPEEEAIKVSNGRINARPNITVQPNGDNIFATVKVGEVILNEEQQKKLGGAKTFRSIGVPGFASGGIFDVPKQTRSFASGGFTGLGDFPLGDNLRAPINPQSFLNSSSANNVELKRLVFDNTNDLKKVMDSVNRQTDNINSLARQTNQRIDRIKVQVVAKEVEDTNNKTKKASAIGTL